MLTPYQSYRKVEEVFFDECSQLKTTIEKNRKKKNVYSKQMLVPKICSIEKRRGRYRSGVSPTFPQLAAFVRPDGSVPWKQTLQEAPIKY